STRDEIERLWHPQGMAAQPAQPAADTPARTDKTEKPAPRWFRLSNGRQVNLADWKVVPEALPVPPDVMQTFFPNIPVATPTTFLVNVNTLEALPLLQGATDAAGFMARMDTVLQMYGGKKGAK
uniref:type-F conjugative transfer system pilin assembly thiol-disulfide isomerase TrbB n=1 Tax=Escherichia coli TaxID=562 RepID=UPI001F4A5AD3